MLRSAKLIQIQIIAATNYSCSKDEQVCEKCQNQKADQKAPEMSVLLLLSSIFGRRSEKRSG